jgi:hypothetical protein
MERYNFNPHECFGNFDFKGGTACLLVDSNGHKMDKNFRRVNKNGWLIDSPDDGNIIDNTGRIKLVYE